MALSFCRALECSSHVRRRTRPGQGTGLDGEREFMTSELWVTGKTGYLGLEIRGQGRGLHSWLAIPPLRCVLLAVRRPGAQPCSSPWGCPRARSLAAWLKPLWHPIVTWLLVPSAGNKGGWLQEGPQVPCHLERFSSSWWGAENGVPGALRGWDLLPTGNLSHCGIPEWALPIPSSSLFRQTFLPEDDFVQRVLSHHTSVENPLTVRHCT